MARQISKEIAAPQESRCREPIAATRRSIARQGRGRTLVRGLLAAGLACATIAAANVHAASNVVRYTRDAAGNILAIERDNPSPVSISGIAPASGPVGTVVAITGTGFAPSPAGNVVSFNGVAATVTFATSNTLTAAVPSRATTGRIAVTVAGNSAASPLEFSVTSSGTPTVAGFTPPGGVAGTLVIVVGTNFNPAAGATTVKLNQANAVVSTVTSTQLAFVVPASTGSGKVRVATTTGNAVSAVDFIVPPATHAITDIAAMVRLVADAAPQSIGLFAFDKIGLILFDGNPGDWLSLQIGNFVINPAGAAISYTVYKPDTTQLATGTLSATNLSIHVPPLPAAGTYAVVLRSGTSQVSLDARLEANRVIPGDGSTIAVVRGAGQSTRALIAPVAGEQKALSIQAVASVPAGVGLGYEIALPNGSTFRRGTVDGFGAAALLPPFTTTGTHPVVIASTLFTTQASYQLALLAGIPLPVDGGAQPLAITVPGAGARLNFVGMAGENLGLGMTGAVRDSAPAMGSTFSVYKPDGGLLVSGSCYAGGTQCSANLANLPVTGNYSVIVQPWSGATGTLQVWLSHDVTGTLASGVPLGLALARPGQNGRLTIAGVAGAVIAVQVRGVATTPASLGLLVLINRPDGTSHLSAHLTGKGETLVPPPLPVTGTYTVFVEPEAAAQGAATATMEVLLDPGRSLVVDGPTVLSTIATAGASARYTFAGTAGQSLGLGISNLALTSAADATVSVYRPDGVTLTSTACSAAASRCGSNLAKLPTTGTYGIVVRPAGGASGTFGATLSTDLAGTLALGVAMPIILDRPGQNARLAFAGTAGQTLRLGWSGVAIAGATTNALAYLVHPDGTTLSGTPFANGIAGGSNLPTLPVTGTYTIFIDPPVGTSMIATLMLTTR